jgi:aspartate racemase
MQTIGMIGGIAPPSTIDYYRLLMEGYRSRRQDGSQPLLIINSIDLRRLLDLAAASDRPPLAEFLIAEVTKLERAGADFGFFASNTPHLVFDEVQARSPIPLVSIVEAAASATAAQGLKRVGLLGARFVMEGGFYPRVFERHGVSVSIPDAEDREFVHHRYLTELVRENFRDETREGITAVIDRMRERAGIEAVVLGGTELPLLFRDGPPVGLPLLDTTRIHVDAILERLLTPTV